VSVHAELREHRADEVLNRDYLALRGTVLRAVAGWLRRSSIFFDEADLEAHYNTAWQGYYNELRAGRTVEKPEAFLITIVRRRAIDDVRRRDSQGRAVTYEVTEEELAGVGADTDVAARLDDRVKLKQFMEGLKDRLGRRELEAAALCYIHGYSRPEAAKVLDVEPKRMEKIMDAVSKKVGAFVRDIEAGAWCEARRSLMNAYAFGVLDKDGPRHRQAIEHLEGCPPCRRYVRAAQGLAAIVPPVALPVGPLPPHGHMTGELLEKVNGLLHNSAHLADQAGGAKAGAAGALAAGTGGAAAAGGGGTAATGVGASIAAKAAAVVLAATAAGGGAVATGAVELPGRADGSPAASTRTVAAKAPAVPAGFTSVSLPREPRAGTLLARPAAHRAEKTRKKAREKARTAKPAIRRASASATPTRTVTPATTPPRVAPAPAPTTAPRRATPASSRPGSEFSVEG
jgi:DNA-directed RNA polymerase specialized sigma24 family protein